MIRIVNMPLHWPTVEMPNWIILLCFRHWKSLGMPYNSYHYEILFILLLTKHFPIDEFQ